MVSSIVEGICTNYLNYQDALSEPLYTPGQSFSPVVITSAIYDSGLCREDLLPAACFLWFPPLPSSNYVLCRETCNNLFEECTPGVFFFIDFSRDDCSNFPLRREADGLCIGGKFTTIVAFLFHCRRS